ncbi:hypothetical protein P171DRAFT_430882 [Karstenula rhodostoma CBS 690.94]|uniref:Uncharacterized protein n=1 Tax=Karstenula rhodostoma CBS 690.94 TaxID=1392251 RepID=A0A9P4PJS8_9PLEO|nr:hypothetical protein P171DRAFT_430882 [Karstenula rhodostoma CBS 690.94]
MSSDLDVRMDEQSDLAASEIRSLRNQTAVLQDKLDRSVAKIMRLQGGIDQITDGDVKKRFEGVFSAIQDWVSEIELDLMRHSRDFRDVFQEILRQEEQEALLLSLGFRAQNEDENGRPIWDPISMEYVDMRWLGTLDTCINVILSRVIWCRLRHRIFYSLYPVGLNEPAQEGLDYIIQAIEDGNDGETKIEAEAVFRANKWRAESMAILVSTKRFRKDKDSDMQDLLEDLQDDLTSWPTLIDTETLNRHIERLEINVIGPAVELKQTIACSLAEYCLVEPQGETLKAARDDDRPWEYISKDIVEWRDRDPSETYGDMFRLFPGVYRKGMKDAEDVVLVKPTLLVLNRETIGMLQEYRKSNGSTQHRRQRSPGKVGMAHSRKSSQPPPSSRSSTTRSKNDRRTPHSQRDESYPDSSGWDRVVRGWDRILRTPKPKGSVHDKRLEENPASDTKARLHRRATEDYEFRETLPREVKGKEKRSKRADPTPVSSRKPSLSQPRPEAAIPPSPPSEYSAGLTAQTLQHEVEREYREGHGTLVDNETNFPIPPTRRREGEEVESGNIDSPVEMYSILETGMRTNAQYITAEPGQLVRSPGQGHSLRDHPNSEGFRKVRSQYHRYSTT